MKTGDLVRIRRRPRVCAVNKTRDPKGKDFGCGVVLEVRPAKYVTGNIYVISRNGKEEWYDDTWDLEVLCEAK
tara:strand:- start:346 stop:564 length:219 start_codon:yes stop_codon:yes gene_type:complete